MYSVCSLIYVSMYVYSYPSTHGISGLAAGGAWEQFEKLLRMTIEWTQRYTWRRFMLQVRDAHGGRDRASLEMHWEALIEWTQRCTWRSWSSTFGDSLGGQDRARLEEYLQAVERRHARCWDSIHRLVNLQPRESDEVTLPSNCLMESWLVMVDLLGRHVWSWRFIQGSTHNCENDGKTDNLWWMLYSVYAVLGVCCAQCLLMIMAWRDSEGRLKFVFYIDGRETEMGDEDGNNVEEPSGYEISGVWLAWVYWQDLISVLSPAGSGVVPVIPGMVNWLAHQILSSPSFSWWFPPSPLISLILCHHPKTRSQVIPINLSMPWSWFNTEYSIHRVLYPPSTASSQDSLSPAPSQSLIFWQTIVYSTLYIPTITC